MKGVNKMETYTKYTLENIQKNISLDLGDVLNKAIEVAANLQEKRLICDMLKHHDDLNNQLLMRVIDYSEKVMDKSMEFFGRRESQYLQAGKFAKVFGFKRWNSIETEAFSSALSDTEQILHLTSPLENPAVKALIASRVQRQQALLCHLSSMLEQEPIKKLDFEPLRKILGG